MHQLLLILSVLLIILTMPINSFSSDDNFDYNYGLGILQLRSQSPAQSLRLTMPSVIPGAFKPGILGIHAGTTWTNVWIDSSEVALDYEMLDTHIAVSYGINKRLGLGIAFDQRNYFGGAMDNFIQEFHDIFGIDQNGRDRVDRNLSRIVRYDDQGNIIFETDNLSYLENNGITLFSQYILSHGSNRWPAIGVSGVLRYGLNTPSSEDNHEPLDWSIGIGLSKRWTDTWYMYSHLGYTNYGRTEMSGLEFKDDAISFLLALAWQWKPNSSILFQYVYSEGVVKDFGSLSNPSHEINLGFKWQLSSGSIIEFALVENVITFDNSPDFGLHFALSYPF
ncbi:MAG: DUF3187 family protein [Thermodesulfobacteriota bacterium]|nr:DUF3187 family protein [Thermodesulfobacteriota bacterium]